MGVVLLLSLGMNVGIVAMLAMHRFRERPLPVGAELPVAGPMVPADLAERMADRLRLEGAEWSRFVAIQKSFLDRAVGGRRELEKLRQELRREMTSTAPDRSRVLDLVARSTALQAELERAFVVSVLDSRELLGPREERAYLAMLGRLRSLVVGGGPQRGSGPGGRGFGPAAGEAGPRDDPTLADEGWPADGVVLPDGSGREVVGTDGGEKDRADGGWITGPGNLGVRTVPATPDWERSAAGRSEPPAGGWERPAALGDSPSAGDTAAGWAPDASRAAPAERGNRLAPRGGEGAAAGELRRGPGAGPRAGAGGPLEEAHRPWRDRRDLRRERLEAFPRQQPWQTGGRPRFPGDQPAAPAGAPEARDIPVVPATEPLPAAEAGEVPSAPPPTESPTEPPVPSPKPPGTRAESSG